MWRFLIDEDMARSTAGVLREAGHLAEDVRDVGLRGHPDPDVYQYAQAQRAVIVTADKGFSNILQFPPGTHAGLIVVRVPEELPTREVNRELLRALQNLEGEDLAGLLIIVEVGRARVRRPARP